MRNTIKKAELSLGYYKAIAFITILLFCQLASAQAQTTNLPTDTWFPINNFQPAPGPENYFSIESPFIGDDMKPTAGLTLAYQHRPLVIYSCDANDNCGDDATSGIDDDTINLVENFWLLDINGSFNFLKRFQVGLALPLILAQKGQTFEAQPHATGVALVGSDDYVDGAVLGDLRLHLKVRILGKEGEDGFGLAAAVIPTFPLGYWADYAEGYASDQAISVTLPNVAAAYRIKGFRAALNLGFQLRKKVEFLSMEFGHNLKYGGAVGYSIIPAIEIIGEIYGKKAFVSEEFTDMESAPLVFMGGGRFKVKDFMFNLAGGGGIISGIGVPQFQIMLGAAWAPRTDKTKDKNSNITEYDIDGDGVDNTADECPEQPEDWDNYQDEDGCPEEDNDGDGIIDGYDTCPNVKEDIDKFRDEDGCPDLDHDEDGIKEPTDKCPDLAEDYDDFEDTDGCPEKDNDKDGLEDGVDKCINEAEDIDGFQDEDGCPELDNDNDGVPDTADKCPDQSETLNGVKDDDGCPDRGEVLVVVTKEKIEIKKKIQFGKNSAQIKGGESFEILELVLKVLKNNPAIRVTIEGHTDNRGNPAKNRTLSKQRAESVKAWLVGKGIVADRLEAVGMGPDAPIVSNKYKSGRKINRRVEFVIIQPEGAADDSQEGAGEEGDSMDFTAGDDDDASDDGEGDSMDFTIEEEEAPSDEGATMDFTEEED